MGVRCYCACADPLNNEWEIIKFARAQDLGREGLWKGSDCAILQREKNRLRNITAHAQIH